jgi:hypothetical protein
MTNLAVGQQVLGTVVEVAHHFRLVGQTRLEKVGGQRVDPAVQFAPCDDPAALCLRRPLRHPPSNGLADIRKVPVGFRGFLIHGVRRYQTETLCDRI